MLGTVRFALAALFAVTTLSIAAGPAQADETITVSGTVVDPAGNPVAGAEIWDGAFRRQTFGENDPFAFCADRAPTTGTPLAVSGADGSFTFSCVSDGYVIVYAVAPDGAYANAGGSYVGPGPHAGGC